MAQSEERPPNIIFILADDLGIGDLGPYGQQLIKTPNLDKMAKEGMKLTEFYAGSTVCAPSRASLLTGQHTGNTLVRGNGEFPLDPDREILPEILKKAGYTNAMFGKWGLGLAGTSGSPETRGWDYFVGHLHHVAAHYQRPDSLDRVKDGRLDRVKIPEGTYANDFFTEEAIRFIENHDEHSPFFLYLSYTIPHAELVVPERYLDLYLNEKKESKFSPETVWPEGRHYGPQDFPKAAYAALVSSLDDYLGQVMMTLREKGIDENTLVIFTSDNGTHVEGGRTMEDVDYFKSSGEYKGVKRDLYAGGIKEPFIARWPGVIKADTKSDHRAAFWDVLPTFSALAGVDIRELEHDGISFVPSLTGKKQKKHPWLYWEFHEYGGKQALLKGDWKVVRLNVSENPANPVELYHIGKDPGEVNNIADRHPKRAQKMTRLMDSIRTPNPNFNFGIIP